MTIKVTIQPVKDLGGTYPYYYTLDDGVEVGTAGELMLVSMRNPDDNSPVEFRIYAPGTWKEVNAVWHDEGEE